MLSAPAVCPLCLDHQQLHCTPFETPDLHSKALPVCAVSCITKPAVLCFAAHCVPCNIGKVEELQEVIRGIEAVGKSVHLRLLHTKQPNDGVINFPFLQQCTTEQGLLTKVQMTRVRFLYDFIVVAVVRQQVSISPPKVLISADKKGALARGVVLNRESPVHSIGGSMRFECPQCWLYCASICLMTEQCTLLQNYLRSAASSCSAAHANACLCREKCSNGAAAALVRSLCWTLALKCATR